MDTPRAGNNFFEELMVVLVLYKLEIHESPAVISLTTSLQYRQQKTSIFIYDNSPSAHSYKSDENWITMYRHDSSNPGVSKAYNEGFNYAKAQNKRWMLLVDQDTEFEKDFFLKCRSAIEVHDKEKIFAPIMMDLKGIVSPFIFQFSRGVRLKEIKEGRYQLAEKKFINTGMLINRDLFEKAGGYDARFKLDFSDLVFLERLKSVAKTFLVIDSRCNQSLFVSTRHSLQENLERFAVYCKAANLFSKQTGNSWVTLWKYVRAMMFFCKFFDWRFIITAFAK